MPMLGKFPFSFSNRIFSIANIKGVGIDDRYLYTRPNWYVTLCCKKSIVGFCSNNRLDRISNFCFKGYFHPFRYPARYPLRQLVPMSQDYEDSGAVQNNHRLRQCRFFTFSFCLVPPTVKAFDFSAIEHVKPTTCGNSPDKFVKHLRLLTGFTSFCVEAGKKVLCSGKLRRSLLCIQHKLAVILWQF